jgi:hypothetical protein
MLPRHFAIVIIIRVIKSLNPTDFIMIIEFSKSAK